VYAKKVHSRGAIDELIFGAAEVAAWVIRFVVVVVVQTWFCE
jgi:hypothetical protein